jgi:uncharacterized membrane protein
MEGPLILIALVLCGAVFLAPILAIIALVRTAGLRSTVEGLRRDLAAVEARLSALVKTTQASGAPPAASVLRVPVPAAVSRPLTPDTPPVSPPTPSSPELRRPVAAADGSVPAAKRPPLAPPSRRLPTPPPTTPSGPSFDWESLLGLRGAAWLGGIAMVFGAALLAKWAIDEGLFTPAMRIFALIAMGLGALCGAELSLRRGYETTANAVSGAGIAILYIAFFAGHSLYHLFPAAVAFLMMSLVTVVAGAVAIRYDAVFTAVLGLLGGFATPIVVSSGVDQPVALFSYIFLLNIGLLAAALYKRWHGLVLLALGATFAIELGWYVRFMSPEKVVIGLTAFLALGLLYIALPFLEGGEDQGVAIAGVAGGIVPLLFGVLVAGRASYAGEWPLLFMYIALLDAALLAVSVLRRRPALLLAASLATALFLPTWAGLNLREANALWGPTLAAVLIVAVLNLGPSLARAFGPELRQMERTVQQGSGWLAGLGLGLFGLALVARGLGDPPWAFLVLCVALVLVLLARSGEGRLAGALMASALGLAVLIQIWFFATTHGPTLLRNLSVPLLLALILSVAAASRARSRPSGKLDAEHEGATLVALATAVAGLFGCLSATALGSDPLPLLAALAVAMILLMITAARSDWTLLAPFGLAASALFATSWHVAYFHTLDLATALTGYGAFYVAFLALPFIVAASGRANVDRADGLWFASALSGPFFFYPLYRAPVDAWGKGFIGVLPVLMAAATVLALSGVSRHFTAARGDLPAARLRLRYLALFATVALGFIAVAIPLQLDRQWITIGWALEAMAVLWLFGRLPHPWLPAASALLFGAVGVRLLMNPEVFHYQPRGAPIVNWLLYTYAVPALCCFFGARLLRQAEERPGVGDAAAQWRWLAPAAGLLGLVLVFALINLEIADFYGQGTFIELSGARRLDRDLTTSVAWGLYALTLLAIGIWRRGRALRYVGLAVLILTVGKVFLYDLSHLTGLHRILSFFGLGAALVLVSLVYQRFVVTRGAAR